MWYMWYWNSVLVALVGVLLADAAGLMPQGAAELGRGRSPQNTQQLSRRGKVAELRWKCLIGPLSH